MKEIEIIPLARKKMARRGVSVQWVKEALAQPEQVVEGYGGRFVAHKRYRIRGKEMLLRVAYEEISGKFIVITAYLTSAVERY